MYYNQNSASFFNYDANLILQMTNPRLLIERYYTDAKMPNDIILQKVSFVELKMAVFG